MGAALLILTSCESREVNDHVDLAQAHPTLAPTSTEHQLAIRFKLNDIIEQHDTLRIESGKLKSGQTLSHLLSPHGVSNQMLHTLGVDGKAVYNAGKMRVGNMWWLFKSAAGLPLRLVYGRNTRDFVVYDVVEGTVKLGQLPVETRESRAQGVITQSLSQDFEKAGLPVALSVAMAGVYAWTVDFSRVQVGDRYRVIYTQDYVSGKAYDLPKIIAAEFTHRNRALPAYRYNQGDGFDYFDDQGASLRKAFLKAPVEFSRISSHYNKRRLHPVLNRIKPHLGTDYAAAHGTPILAVGDGVVSKASYTKGNGKYVKIRHNDTYETQYLHMSKRAVKKGQRVKQGETIGYVGSTGLATGPHVCFRFWKNGTQVNHLKEDFPPSEPILPAHLEAFKARAADLRIALDAIAQ